VTPKINALVCGDRGNTTKSIEERHVRKLCSDCRFVREVLNGNARHLRALNTEFGDAIVDEISQSILSLQLLSDICVRHLTPDDDFVFVPQSGDPGAEEGKMSEIETEQNVQFADVDAQNMTEVDAYVDPTRRLMDTNTASLGDFMSRPVRIATYTWTQGGSVDAVIEPWKLFFNDARVVNRIAHFNLLRCKLHVRVTVNGTPFHFGRAMITYLPLHVYDEMSVKTVPLADAAYKVGISQRPRLMINPTCSQGGEMILPFFFHKNYLSIPDSEWEDMGLLMITELASLKHANGATDPVTISMFAWASEVEMDVLTSDKPLTMVSQSGTSEMKEANMKGFISEPATAFAKTLSKLTVFPQIAPLATATSMGATAIAGIAKYFGYSRPVITKAPDRVRNQMSSSFALCNVPDLSEKLTVDCAQELTVDPRISGVGSEDPLTISNIAQRESYLTQFDWLQSNSPDDMLFNIRLTPGSWFAKAADSKFHFTPVCAMAFPFAYWTGKLRLRFQFVTSAYHRGRVMVRYDPNVSHTLDFNTNFIEVIDISENSDFTIEVGVAQQVSLLQNAFPAGGTSNYYGTTPLTPITGSRDNGFLSLTVINELTTPNSTANNDIKVNVFVSAGDDFEVFVPRDTGISSLTMDQQSGVPSGTPIDAACNMAYEGPVTQMCIGTTNSDDINKVFIGESIVSLRTLLKRFTMHENMIGGDTSISTLELKRCAFPLFRGYVPGAIDFTSVPAPDTPYNYVNTHLLHYVSSMFSGHRGSIRYKIAPVGNVNDKTVLAVSLDSPPSAFADDSSGAATVLTAYDARAEAMQPDVIKQWALPYGSSGTAVHYPGINRVMEFEVPYYNNLRFCPGKQLDFGANPGSFYGGFTLRGRINLSDTDAALQSYVASGEDFQVYFFTGIPPFSVSTTTPTPQAPP